MKEVVHELRFGVARCKTVKGLPFEWPIGHRWERPDKFLEVPLAERCPHCMKARITGGTTTKEAP